jgi:hypothetical protein
MSVYQTLPSGAAARPIGSTLLPDFGSRSTWPSRTRPSAAAPSIVNQIAPSGAAATATGMSCRWAIGYSTKRTRDPPAASQ